MELRYQELLAKLKRFSPNSKKKKPDQLIREFLEINQTLTPGDIKLLGSKYEEWKITCLYYFLTNPDSSLKIYSIAPDIIKKYFDMKIKFYNPELTLNCRDNFVHYYEDQITQI